MDNSVMSINAPVAYALEDFSADAIRARIAEAQRVASGSGSEQDIAVAKIQLEVGHPKRKREGITIGPQQRVTDLVCRFLRPSLPTSNRPAMTYGVGSI